MNFTSHPSIFKYGPAVIVGFAMACGGNDEEPAVVLSAADQLIERSIAFHDPDTLWARERLHIQWFGTGSDGEERTNVQLVFHADQNKFELSGRYRDSALEYQADGATWTATVDGSDSFDDDVMQRMGLHRENGMLWRSYYGFLAGMPMKLRDPGTRVDPEPIRTRFDDRDVESIRVEYDADVGTDTWYFYFDPETAELVGCRFYHDETANDGEYIHMEGLTAAGSLRIPRHRRWFVNADGRFLGADEVRSMEVVEAEGL